MKLLSFALPDLRGLERGCRRIELVEGEPTAELGGEDKIGGRKPPSSPRFIILGASIVRREKALVEK